MLRTYDREHKSLRQNVSMECVKMMFGLLLAEWTNGTKRTRRPSNLINVEEPYWRVVNSRRSISPRKYAIIFYSSAERNESNVFNYFYPFLPSFLLVRFRHNFLAFQHQNKKTKKNYKNLELAKEACRLTNIFPSTFARNQQINLFCANWSRGVSHWERFWAEAEPKTPVVSQSRLLLPLTNWSLWNTCESLRLCEERISCFSFSYCEQLIRNWKRQQLDQKLKKA